MTFGSAGQYDLDTKYIPDVLGLRDRRPEAAVVKVMSRKDKVMSRKDKVMSRKKCSGADTG